MNRIVPAIFLIFGAVIVGLVYLKPEWREFSSLNKRVNRLQELNKKLDLLGEERDKLRGEITAILERARERLALALPEGPDARGLLILMEERAQRDGLTLQGITLDTKKDAKAPPPSNQPEPAPITSPPPRTSIKELPFQLSLRGTYDAMKRFLNTLEQSLRLLDVNTLIFQAPNQDNVLNFNVSARAYHQ